MSATKMSPLPRTEMDALLLGRLDELTVSCESSARSKNFLGVLMSIIVLMLISSLIVAAIVILNPEIVNLSSRQYASREAITLEEAMLGELSGNSFTYQWLTPVDFASDHHHHHHHHQQQQPAYDELLFEDSKNLNIISIGAPSFGKGNKPFSLLNPTNNNNSNNDHNRTNHQHLSAQIGSPPTQQSSLTTAAKLTTLISNSSLLSSIEYQGFKLSPSKRFLLIWTSKRKQFRHTFTAKYFLYDIKLDLITMLNTKRASATPFGQFGPANVFENLDSASQYLNTNQVGDNDELARFQLVDWFQQTIATEQAESSSRQPTSNQVDSLILIQNNDLYLLRDVANNIGRPNQMDGPSLSSFSWPIRLTFDGKHDEIYNGVPDWLYEEEILSDASAYQLSPKSTSLAYMSFNDSQVEFMSFQNYGSPGDILPRLQRVRYPKAGRVNPRVSVHIIDGLNGASTSDDNPTALSLPDIELRLPDNLETRQHYINRIKWLTDDKLALVWLNRHQNESYFVICARQFNWKCEQNLHLKASNGWLDLTDDLTPLDEDYYLALLFRDEGFEAGSFKQVAKISINKSNSYTFLTGGRREALSVNGIDKKRSLLYYTSTIENEPGQRQLFSTSLGGESEQTGNNNQPHCLTCDHHPEECLYNFVKMSPSTSYYIFECDGPGVPRTELRLTKLPSPGLLSSAASRRQIFPPAPLMEDSRRRLIENSPANNGGLLESQQKQQQQQQPSAGNNNNASQLPVSSRSEEDERAFASNYYYNASAAYPLTGSTLLWTIEDNQALRAKLTYGKGMPLTMRLKVPIPNTNYSANVLMLLPPQIGFRNTFGRVPPMAGGGVGGFGGFGGVGSVGSVGNSGTGTGSGQSRSARDASQAGPNLPASGKPQGAGPSSATTSMRQPPIHVHYTPSSITDYTSQLSSGQQFPMVVDVYGGPGSQRVDYRYHIGFGHYLASSRRTIYAMIDGRGSGYQGTKRLYELYHRLGSVEIEDQIEVSAYLTRNFSFIDPAKVAIWGWSYGGYAAAMALARSNALAISQLQAQVRGQANMSTSASAMASIPAPTSALSSPSPLTNPAALANTLARPFYLAVANNRQQQQQQSTRALSLPLGGVFECAASVAPVTNWIYYDTAYTERYMSAPYPNEQYDEFRLGDHETSNINELAALNPTTNSIDGANKLFDRQHPSTSPPLTRSDSIASKWLPLNQTTLIDSTYLKPPTSSSSSSSSSTSATSPLSELVQKAAGRTASSLSSSSSADQTARYQLNLNQRYRNASLIEQIPNIDRKRFLLIHGTADDNVHFQQSIMLMKRLIQRNVMFETRIYPDQDHGIANKADKLHLAATLSNFFAECFDMAQL